MTYLAAVERRRPFPKHSAYERVTSVACNINLLASFAPSKKCLPNNLPKIGTKYVNIYLLQNKRNNNSCLDRFSKFIRITVVAFLIFDLFVHF